MNKHLTGILLPLTDRQQQTLDFMWGFYLENDMLPPCRVTADHFGFAPNAIRDTVKVLVRKSYIEKNTVGKYRFTDVFHEEQESPKEAV